MHHDEAPQGDIVREFRARMKSYSLATAALSFTPGACITGLLFLNGGKSKLPRIQSNEPVLTEEFDIIPTELQEFTAVTQKFADVYGFALRIDHPQQGSKTILIQLWKDDLRIMVNNPNSTNEFSMSIYSMCGRPEFLGGVDEIKREFQNQVISSVVN